MNIDPDMVRVLGRLRQEGLAYGDIHSLGKEPTALARAAPVLLEMLGAVSSFRVKEEIVRVASGAPIPPQPLVDELRRLTPEIERDVKPSGSLDHLSGADLIAELRRIRTEPTGASSLGWALGDALAKRADFSVFEEIGALLRDKRLGKSRQMLPYALARIPSRRDDAIRLLTDVLGDEEITPQAIDALGQMQAVEAIPAIRKFLDSRDSLIKSEARKALRKLEKGTPGSAGGELQGPRHSPRIPEDLTEASTNFDRDQVTALLERLTSHLGGFGPSEVERIALRLLEMEPDEEETFEFQVLYKGQRIPFYVRVYMDDVDSPDIAFVTRKSLATRIEQLIDELEG